MDKNSINYEVWKKLNKDKPISINTTSIKETIKDSKELFCDRMKKFKEFTNDKKC